MNDLSKRKLATAHDDLQLVANAVDRDFPIRVICGERNEKEQRAAFESGASNVEFPNSLHNINPVARRFKAWAIDCIPESIIDKKGVIDWNNIAEFEKMLLVFEQKGDELDVKLRFGRDFKNKKGKPLRDMPHVELA